MISIVLQVDEKLAERAKRVAEQQNVTVDVLVEQYFAQLPDDTTEGAKLGTEQLLETLCKLSRPMGGKPWKDRDELYER
jgi:hypothetical protein